MNKLIKNVSFGTSFRVGRYSNVMLNRIYEIVYQNFDLNKFYSYIVIHFFAQAIKLILKKCTHST